MQTEEQQYEYYATKELAPRPGNNFATTYYKMDKAETKRLQETVNALASSFDNLPKHELQEIDNALKGKLTSKRDTKGKYTTRQIVKDLQKQLASGKDVPSGMIGRWNKAFEGTDLDIILVKAGTKQEQTTSTFNELFG